MNNKPMKPFSEPRVASARRLLICIPIVHTQADMGALNEPIQRLKVKKLGKKMWEHNLELVKDFWTHIEQATEGLALSYEKVRLYQDGRSKRLPRARWPKCPARCSTISRLARSVSSSTGRGISANGRGAT